MMKFGFFTMPEHSPKENWNLSYDRDMDKIVYAEKMGFDEFLIGEHHSGGHENVPVPEYYIAKASALTHRIKLGTGVVALPFHDPFQVAERLAFLDQLTKGRLIMGLGNSSLVHDRELFDIPQEETKARTLEAIDIIETYLNNAEPVSYEGQFWNYNKRVIQVRPYQNRKVPIAVPGLTSDTFFTLAAERGFLAMSGNFTPLVTDNSLGASPSLKRHAQLLDEAAERAGRDPKEVRSQWRILREVYVAESKEEAIEDIRKEAKESYDYLMGIGLGNFMKITGDMSAEDITLDYMIDSVPWIIGSPDECIETIQRMQEELGGFGGLLIDLRSNWTTDDKWRRSTELFARRVMPAFM